VTAYAEESATSPSTQANEAALPSPLTLDYVMRTLTQTHPDLVAAQSRIELSNSKLLQADSTYGLRAYLLGEARYIEPHRAGSVAQRQSSAAYRWKTVVRFWPYR